MDPGDLRCCPWSVAVGCRFGEGLIIQGFDLIILGWRWLHESQPNQRLASGVGVYTPCGAVSTRPWVRENLDLTPVNQRTAISQWGWVFHTLRGGIDPGTGERLFLSGLCRSFSCMEAVMV